MVLVVQQEPPVDGANSYTTVSVFRAYHGARGTDVALYTDQQVEFALIKATQYVDVRFNFVGYQYAKGQDTEWPRSSAFDKRGDRLSGIPKPLAQAVCEYALRSLAADLLADPVREVGRQVKSRTEEVGPIKESVEYEGSAGFQMPSYPLADRILISKGLVIGNLGGLSVGDVGRG